MLRVRVCAAYMGGFLGPKFSKQGSFFGRFSYMCGLPRNWRNIVKNGWFRPKFIMKVGIAAIFSN